MGSNCGANCAASLSIGCLFCCKGCNAEKVRNAFTFIPPLPSYAVETDPEDKTKGRVSYCMEGLHGSALYRQAADSSEVQWTSTRRGTTVPIVWFRRDDLRPDQRPFVLLHCHGNATDIGMMMGPYYELTKVLGVEVVGVEYSGYGAATGRPSSENTYADLEAAYDYVISTGVPPDRIVAYGQSVGSGPVVSLASSKRLSGIILHSPLLSGIKVVDPHPDSVCRPSCVWHLFDFYPNDGRMKALQCPVFIMHGQRDNVIPFYHGYRLHKACPKESRWPAYFPTRAGHNDIVETDMRMYFGEISHFLQNLGKLAVGCELERPKAEGPQQVRIVDRQRFAQAPMVAAPAAAALAGAAACHADDFIGTAPEPAVGPRDGLYERLRLGQASAAQAALAAQPAQAAGDEGQARESQVASHDGGRPSQDALCSER